MTELDRYFADHPTAPEVQAEARLTLAWFVSDAASESAAQYFRLERLEAAGAVRDLEAALDDIRDLERRRAELWQQAAHDLRGNLGVVSNVAHGLALGDLPEQRRETFLGLLQNNIDALHHLLDDVTDLARLHAGQEVRRVAPFDAADLLRRLCDDLRPVAEAKELYLRTLGVATLPVEGDAIKVRRIAQNLLLNALKYTESGGVIVRWGDTVARDDGRWVLTIEDTGPGFHAGPGAPMVSALSATPGEPPVEPDRRRPAGASVARRRPRPGDRQAPERDPQRDPRARHRAGQGHDGARARADALRAARALARRRGVRPGWRRTSLPPRPATRR